MPLRGFIFADYDFCLTETGADGFGTDLRHKVPDGSQHDATRKGVSEMAL